MERQSGRFKVLANCSGLTEPLANLHQVTCSCSLDDFSATGDPNHDVAPHTLEWLPIPPPLRLSLPCEPQSSIFFFPVR